MNVFDLNDKQLTEWRRFEHHVFCRAAIFYFVYHMKRRQLRWIAQNMIGGKVVCHSTVINSLRQFEKMVRTKDDKFYPLLKQISDRLSWPIE